MPQTQFKATGITSDNSDKLQDAGFGVANVKWVNINGDNVVVTHEEDFDAAAFIDALKGADGSVELSAA